LIVYLIQGLSLGVSAAASPGPSQAFMISQALKLGWRRALPVVLAPLISDGPIITLVLLVLTRFPPVFLRIIQLAGGIFVIYLAWKSFQAFRSFQVANVTQADGRHNMWQAAMMNFLSPGPYLFWSLLAGPVLVRGWAEQPIYGVIFVAGFYLAMITGLILLVVLFGAAREIGPRFNRALLGFSSLALFGFGVFQFYQGIFQ
jgi:threonine/homoserine/homoserine lactone efflux protein